MNPDHENSVWAVVGKSLLYAVSLIASLTISQIQAVVGLVSTMLIASVAAVNLYLLWRDKVRQPRRRRKTDFAPTTDNMDLDTLERNSHETDPKR